MVYKVLTATGKSEPVVAAVGDNGVACSEVIAVGVYPNSCVVLNSCVVDKEGCHVVFDKALSLNTYEPILDDGVVDRVPKAFSCLHEPNPVPLSRLVIIV